MFLDRFRAVIVIATLSTPFLTAQIVPVDQVHPLVGTQNEGQTYPAVGLPFAMTQWTPQTRAGEIKCIAPYYFADQKIQGFRGSHFLSGSCVPDFGSLTLMPSTGPLKTAANDRASTFARSSEHASPYAYSVDLKDAGVAAEITGTTRAGIMRFAFAKGPDAHILLENNARGGDGWIRIDPKTQEVTAEVPVRREYAGHGQLAGFSGYFVVQFSEPFTTAGTFVGSQTHAGVLEQIGDGQPLGVHSKPTHKEGEPTYTENPRGGFGAYVQFHNLADGKIIFARIGTSFVSIEEARNNLRAEIPNYDFAAVKAQAKAAWTRAFDHLQVKDNVPATSVFYTALYHALLHPRTYSDVSGAYPGFAHEGKTEHATGFTYYDDFSMWDIFRAQLPMLTIIDPRRDVDIVRSLIAKGEQGGFLPIFPAWNSYTSEMIGDHAAVTIIDAYQKGLRGFDIDEAYRLIRQNATNTADPVKSADGAGRRGLASYLKYGYIPLEDHVLDAFTPHQNEQVSRTLEYSFDDAMIAQLAASLGKSEDAKLFTAHGQNWRNVINPANGFAQGRLLDGSWVTPFDPTKRVSWITEDRPWNYTFFVPQDVPGLIAVDGGKQAFVAKLDQLFDGKYYDHGNEPSHHIAYMYDAADAPAKTQQHVRALMESEYRDAPGGLAGNDDAGQMSAWYVLSALGFYEVSPGIPDYWLGSPRFDDTTLHLDNGHTLHIIAKGAAAGKIYVNRVLLNGAPIAGYKISYNQIMAGGTLTFEMSATHP